MDAGGKLPRQVLQLHAAVVFQRAAQSVQPIHGGGIPLNPTGIAAGAVLTQVLGAELYHIVIAFAAGRHLAAAYSVHCFGNVG